jgi:hypothetical protein
LSMYSTAFLVGSNKTPKPPRRRLRLIAHRPP